MRKKHAILGALALIPFLVAATFNRFTPVTGILKGNAATSVTTAAASTDVTGLWSGTCNSTTFLRGDGSCQAVATSTGANPTASAGLTAVNGAASTFLRSDGAPAISQAIVPAWSGLHTFQANINLDATGAVTNERIWQVQNTAGIWSLVTRTDANGAGNPAIQITRSGTTVTGVTLTGTAVSANASPILTLASGGNITVAPTISSQAICRANGVGCPSLVTQGLRVTAGTATDNGASCTQAPNQNWTSCTRNSTGNLTVTFATSYSSGPVCTANATGAQIYPAINSAGAASVNIVLFNGAGTAVAGTFHLICVGT